jgi:hypothetical protein
MYRVTAYFRDRKISKKFHNVFDAIEYRDDIDAHYPIKVIFKKVRSMREWVYDCWNVVAYDYAIVSMDVVYCVWYYYGQLDRIWY